jgi:small subunit ribosomal protein S16
VPAKVDEAAKAAISASEQVAACFKRMEFLRGIEFLDRRMRRRDAKRRRTVGPSVTKVTLRRTTPGSGEGRGAGFTTAFNALQCPAYLGTSADWATREQQHMVKIRLTRGGAKKRPFYHIIVTDSRSARDGRNIERLGFYNPIATGGEKRVELNAERVKFWVGQGAQMTDKVADLYKQLDKAGGQPAAAAA